MNTEVLDKEALKALEAEQHHQMDLKNYGFWIYLMSDLVIFSLLFATFIVLGKNVAGGESIGELFDLPYLFIETMLLLLSSLSFGLGMIALQNNNTKGVLTGLLLTALLGLGFIGMEINEFILLISEGNGPDKSGALSSFFTLVGTHGLHVSFGIVWIFVMIFQIAKRGISFHSRSRMMTLSLFWHFLDVVWVGVFTVVYLLELV